MDLLGSRGADQLHELAHGGAADDGIVHEHDALPCHDATDGIELDAHRHVATF